MLGGLVSLKETTKMFLISVILAGSYRWYQSHIFVTMTETRSVAALIDKFNVISKAVDQHEAEFSILHQKLDVVTTMLQTLSETIQGFTKSSNGWHQRQHQRPNSPMGHSSLIVQDHQAVMATIPKTIKLEFPRFRGGNPSGWIYKAN